MDDARVFEVAAAHGVDPEVVAELWALLAGSTAAPDDALPTPDHLRPTTPIGRGGTAEVMEAYDTRLQRRVAMKVLHEGVAHDPRARELFVREARATSQLVHPGIVPIHEIGELRDGRPFFTMAIVRGRTLHQVLEEEPATSPAALHRLVALFARAVDAVAYAHDHGVLHRDLKPTNIMIGPFGTVFVLDWGLVRRLPEMAGSSLEGADPVPDLSMPTSGTALGQIAGTPGYMSPEQARGERLTPASDVSALGLILYEVLHCRPALRPGRPWEAIQLAAGGRVPSPTEGPEALRQLVRDATTAEAARRLPHAGAFRERLAHWLDGEAGRHRAQQLVATAAALHDDERTLRASGAARLAEATRRLEDVPSHAPAHDKVAAWADQDAAQQQRRQADELHWQRLQALHGALTHDPGSHAALDALTDHWHAVHQHAEAQRDHATAREALAQLRHHDRGRYADYLAGTGRLTLRTEPPGVPAVLFPLQPRARRLVRGAPQPLPPTPIDLELPVGSYVVVLGDAPGVAVPVQIGRNQVWEQPPVRLPTALGPDDRYVPAGPFLAGWPETTSQSQPWHTARTDAFVIRKHPVTHREYLAFVNALIDAGDEATALRMAPRERGARPDQPGPVCYARDDTGHFVLAPDADGDLWDPDWPVFLVDYEAACAYAAHIAHTTGKPWRLPTEQEWEKAARGVDGRPYPWGEHFDASFACVRASHAGRPVPAPVEAFPDDCSVYGVQGMAGNLRDWCSDPFLDGRADLDPDLAPRVLRGGCWYFSESGSHLSVRFALDIHNRGDTIGFRLARSLAQADFA
ncbi:MAG: SUMF1/EgtB/PvdO family nonheme iron enzyme [Myxococcales bacterium]|nr:SUMF1/EgtB/PvdO family nonheme iron enzyme [Myxococcales bacterium]